MELCDKIRRKMVEAISDFTMLGEGDRVAVAVSGGKDSAVLLKLLLDVRKTAPFSFDLEAVMVDQKQPGFDALAFSRWVDNLGVKLRILEEDTYSIVVAKTPANKAYCSLCSRLRRGILYSYAVDNGFTKIALGHHRDDLNETVLMNLFYSGKLASMPPLLRSDDGRNTVIRPLAYVPERWIAAYAKSLKVPIIPCNLCGSQEGLKRQKIKELIANLESEQPDIGSSMLTAQMNIKTSQLLDRSLHEFNSKP